MATRSLGALLEAHEDARLAELGWRRFTRKVVEKQRLAAAGTAADQRRAPGRQAAERDVRRSRRCRWPLSKARRRAGGSRVKVFGLSLARSKDLMLRARRRSTLSCRVYSRERQIGRRRIQAEERQMSQCVTKILGLREKTPREDAMTKGSIDADGADVGRRIHGCSEGGVEGPRRPRPPPTGSSRITAGDDLIFTHLSARVPGRSITSSSTPMIKCSTRSPPRHW